MVATVGLVSYWSWAIFTELGFRVRITESSQESQLIVVVIVNRLSVQVVIISFGLLFLQIFYFLIKELLFTLFNFAIRLFSKRQIEVLTASSSTRPHISCIQCAICTIYTSDGSKSTLYRSGLLVLGITCLNQ